MRNTQRTSEDQHQSVRSLIEENRKLRAQLAAAQRPQRQYYSSSENSDSQNYENPVKPEKKCRLKQPKTRIRLNPEQSESEISNQQKYQKKTKPDPARVEMFNQLIEENKQLREALNLEPIQYISSKGLNQDEIDGHIENLVNDNDLMKLEVQKQEAAKEKNRYAIHEMFIGLEGNQHGCKFWVPLSSREIEEKEEREAAKLPIPLKPSKPREPCDKCEKAILMYSRVPPYPPNSTYVSDDEKSLVSNYIFTGLNREVEVTDIKRSLFYWRFIEMEREMPNIRLVVHQSKEADSIFGKGFDSAVIVAEHMKYILDDLKANGKVTFLICAADNGVNTTNACGHTTLPSQETVDKASEQYDSLYFSFHGAKALFILNPARIIPLYIVTIQGN